MSTTTLLLSMLACGLITFAIRLSFIAGGRWLPDGLRFQSLLRYVPPSVLAALIAPEIFMRAGQFDPSPTNPRLWAALVALLVAFASRNVLAAIGAGMLTLWGAQLVR